MADRSKVRIGGVGNHALLWLTRLCSWPALLPVFRGLQKFAWHAMNRTSAGFLPVEFTGERRVVTDVLRGVSRGRQAVVFDCGANTGAYAQMVLDESSRRDVPVALHLFEPSPACCETLQTRFAGRGLAIHQAAVSDMSGRAAIYFAWPGSGGTSLGPETGAIQGTSDLGQHAEDVETIALDDFCATHGITTIDLLKLDIEGAELRALDGATRLIAEGRINTIQFELGSPALPLGSSLFRFWTRFSADFDFHLVMAHGLYRIGRYSPDLECFYAASTFVLTRKPARHTS